MPIDSLLRRASSVWACLGTLSCSRTEVDLSCPDLKQSASDIVLAAIEDADTSCQVESDCAAVTARTHCYIGCGGATPVSVAGAEAVHAAIDYVNAEFCRAFEDGHCILTALPCVGDPRVLVPACVGGTCRLIPTPDWTQVTLIRFIEPKPSQLNAFQCSLLTGCVAWQVDVDGRVTIYGEGQSTSTTLSATDLAEVDSALRSARLRAEEVRFVAICPEVRTGPFVSLEIKRGDGFISTASITGCLTSYPSQQELQRIVEVITEY